MRIGTLAGYGQVNRHGYEAGGNKKTDVLAGESFRNKYDEMVSEKEPIQEEEKEEEDISALLHSHLAYLVDKIKNGDTEQKFQIGSLSLTLKEWDKLIARFDESEEDIREQIREAAQKRWERRFPGLQERENTKEETAGA